MPFTNKKTDSWTGLTGEADQMVRNIGHKFWVFEGMDELHVTDDIEVANKWYDENYDGDPTHGENLPEFMAFLIMFAIDEEKAKDLFFEAQDQWRAFNGGVKDFLNVVNVDEADRPILGDETPPDDYEGWSKLMGERYNITC